MKRIQKLLSALLCLCMFMGAALAEDAIEPEISAVTELTPDTVVVTINDEAITWGDLAITYDMLLTQYGSYYDVTQQENIDLFRAVAMENVMVEKLLRQKATELGVGELTAEEAAELEAVAASEWETALEDYITYMRPDVTAESSDEDKAAARTEAEEYYLEGGYTLEILTDEYKYYAILDKVQGLMVQDAVVTDAELDKLYEDLVAQDKALYENDLEGYVAHNSEVDMMSYYAAMYGSANDMDYAWYRPAGFRAVKHILLPVDEELMTAYTDLQARLEEQMNAAETETAEEAPEATEEPVTEAMVNEAKAAIFESLADKIDEINQKVTEGADFDELIATYGVDADGNPSDPGMQSEPYKTTGYEVSAASSNYVPEFVEASMSIAEVGGVSAPYLSSFGIHIVKYLADIPAGPIEMTEAQREAKRAALLAERQNELYNTTIDQWLTDSAIAYTGVIPSYNQLMEEQAADAAAE